jgi:hypothetical protein
VNGKIIRLVFALLSVCHYLNAQAASDFVLIDWGDAAYTVYAGLTADQADKAKAKISTEPAQLVSFTEFAEGRSKFIGERITIDEYANSRAIDGIVELVRKFPGTPFGITWNGGIAFTRNDYQYAKRQFSVYSKSPEEYKQSRSSAPNSDPVNPKGHLGPLLGW